MCGRHVLSSTIVNSLCTIVISFACWFVWLSTFKYSSQLAMYDSYFLCMLLCTIVDSQSNFASTCTTLLFIVFLINYLSAKQYEIPKQYKMNPYKMNTILTDSMIKCTSTYDGLNVYSFVCTLWPNTFYVWCYCTWMIVHMMYDSAQHTQ